MRDLESELIETNPLSFILWYKGGISNSQKPIATKLIVRVSPANAGAEVDVTVSTHKLLLIGAFLLLISTIISLIRHLSFISIVALVIGIIVFIFWDRFLKLRALRKLERILLND